MTLNLRAGLFLMLMAACGREAEVDPRISETWNRHERVLIALQEGRDFKAVDFDRACKFFYDLTGIPVPSDHTPMIDCYPNSESAKALLPLRRWHSRYLHCLYWDEVESEVKVKSGCSPES